VEQASPTALHANRSDMLNVVVSMSTAQRLAAEPKIILPDLPQRVLDRLGLGQQPLQAGVLLPQLLELLGGIGIHPAIRPAPVEQRRRRHCQLVGDLLTSPARRGQLTSAAQFAHNVLTFLAG
jgi:hypothetical protein